MDDGGVCTIGIRGAGRGGGKEILWSRRRKNWGGRVDVCTGRKAEVEEE